MKPLAEHLANRLEALKSAGNYREFAVLECERATHPIARLNRGGIKQDVVVWCSNDYLAMAEDLDVAAAMKAAIDTYGTGSGGTRNISGTSVLHVELENTLASLHQREAALVFTSGSVANNAALQSIASAAPGTICFSDEKIHASMIQGLIASRCEKVVFAHNDLDDLREKLRAADPAAPKMIAVESVYSMDADIAPLAQICELADQFDALLFVDEVHAVGLYGREGAGVAARDGVEDGIDIIQGTLGKAFGQVGGYIAANAEIVDFVRSFGSAFIFTTSLPPAVTAGAIASVNKVRKADAQRAKLFDIVGQTRQAFARRGIPIIGTGTHITPVPVSGATRCRTVAARLRDEHGIYVQPINHPTVPRGAERLRVTGSPNHTAGMVDAIANGLHQLLGEMPQRMAG